MQVQILSFRLLVDSPIILYTYGYDLSEKQMGTLYIVRHSITALNSDITKGDSAERIRGWLDVPLSKDGWEIAKKTAEDLENKGIIKIYTSDLIRAEETAEVISSATGAPVEATELLRPWNLGILQGKDYKKGIKVMKKYVEDADDVVKGGESYNNFYGRWKYALTKLLSAASKLKPDMSLCVVTHSRNIYCLENILSDGDMPVRWEGLLNPGGAIAINVDKNTIDIISNGQE